MIKVTNDVSVFFENNEGEMLIYGAGNAGRWLGYFMNCTNIDFSCYLDKQIDREGALFNDKPVFSPSKLAEYKDKSVRIIVAMMHYKEAMFDILWLEHKYGFNALCFVPQYYDSVEKCERYNINKFLGYFRKKMIIGNPPTIISNDCTAGFIYDALDMALLSPTINTSFEINDFLKVCNDPKHYLCAQLKNQRWERTYTPKGTPRAGEPKEIPVFDLDDIKISFGHENDIDKIFEQWDIMKDFINWDRLIFVLQDLHDAIPLHAIKKYDDMCYKHIFVNMRSQYNLPSENIVYFRDNWFHNKDNAIENYFDLVGWINS